MKYEIKGLNLPYVEITLERGEKIHTERGGMSWMSETMDMKTNAGGSIGKALSRAFTGESMFQNVYTATKDGDMIAVSSSFPDKFCHRCQRTANYCSKKGFPSPRRQRRYEHLLSKEIRCRFLRRRRFHHAKIHRQRNRLLGNRRFVGRKRTGTGRNPYPRYRLPCRNDRKR